MHGTICPECNEDGGQHRKECSRPAERKRGGRRKLRTKAQKIGRRSRQKGATFERWVAHVFSAALGVNAKRGIGQARAAGEVADIDGMPAFWIEAKHRKLPNIRDAIAQAEEARGDRNLWPLAVVKYHGDGEVIVGMRLDDFLVMAKEWWEGK